MDNSIFDLLEPIVSEAARADPDLTVIEAAALSQAISTKRIADKVCGIGGLHGDITNMAWEAGRSFAAGQRTG